MSHSIADKEKELKAKLKLIHKDEEEMLDGIMTGLGMSAILTQFIHEVVVPEGYNLPTMVKYAMSITAGNMCAFLSAHPETELERMKFPTYKMAENEQVEEYTRRKFISVIKILYETMVEGTDGIG
jgi:hypothetical protein